MTRSVTSARDMLVIALESARRRSTDAISDISAKEYHWEPLSASERSSDLHLAPNMKKVWRVFQKEGLWVYDYTPEALHPSPFTTIAWIMNHIAQTGDMYLYCVKSGKPESVDRSWDDLPVYPDHQHMVAYILRVIEETQGYLDSIPEAKINFELNRLAPAPWGEMRPVFQNIWDGIFCHTIEHAVQIAVLKDRIREIARHG